MIQAEARAYCARLLREMARDADAHQHASLLYAAGRLDRMSTSTHTENVPPVLPVGIDPISVNALQGGWNWNFQFTNGYGVSVVLHEGSYGHNDGLYEILLTKAIKIGQPGWVTPDKDMIDSILKSEPGGDTDGLYGWLTLDQVSAILGAVRGYETPVQRATREFGTTYHVSIVTPDGTWSGTDTGARF